MISCVDDDEVLEKYKTFRINIEDLQNAGLNALIVYDDKYVKTKLRTYGNKVYSNFHGVDVAEDAVECEYFAIIFINSLLVYENKYYFQV